MQQSYCQFNSIWKLWKNSQRQQLKAANMSNKYSFMNSCTYCKLWNLSAFVLATRMTSYSVVGTRRGDWRRYGLLSNDLNASNVSELPFCCTHSIINGWQKLRNVIVGVLMLWYLFYEFQNLWCWFESKKQQKPQSSQKTGTA